jgi:hypothetical protein
MCNEPRTILNAAKLRERTMLLIRSIALHLSALLAALPCVAAAPDSADSVKMNQIQVIGTHNSYHAGLASSEAKLWQQKNPTLY